MRPASVTDFRDGSGLFVMANFWPFICFQMGVPIMEHGHSTR
jgi:hypothetical protein